MRLGTQGWAVRCSSPIAQPTECGIHESDLHLSYISGILDTYSKDCRTAASKISSQLLNMVNNAYGDSLEQLQATCAGEIISLQTTVNQEITNFQANLRVELDRVTQKATDLLSAEITKTLEDARYANEQLLKASYKPDERNVKLRQVEAGLRNNSCKVIEKIERLFTETVGEIFEKQVAAFTENRRKLTENLTRAISDTSGRMVALSEAQISTLECTLKKASDRVIKEETGEFNKVINEVKLHILSLCCLKFVNDPSLKEAR